MHPIFQEAISSWASGLPLTVAFLLVLRPTPARMRIAAALWWVAGLARTGFLGFRLFLALAMAAAFSPGVSTVMGLLLPGVWLAVLIAEGLLLRPSVPRTTALRYGRPLVLLLDPLLYAVPAWGPPFPIFPLGPAWMASAVLWFWIRERMESFVQLPPPPGLGEPAPPLEDRTGVAD